MKSILQEASSIAKAIEQAWIKAGKPKEFSVKIYEESEKNFIGLTSKNAKIGIFYQEKQQAPPGRYPRKHGAQQRRFHPRRDSWRKPDARRQGPQERRPLDDRHGEDQGMQGTAERRQEQRPHPQHRQEDRQIPQRPQHEQQEKQSSQLQQRELKHKAPQPPKDSDKKDG
jgi:hypothetical protein